MAKTINIADIIKQLEQAQKSANDANLKRYAEGLAELTGGRQSMRDYYSQAQSLIQDIGKTAIDDVNRGSARLAGSTRQDLISSGLSSSTVLGSMMRGVEEQRQRGQQSVREGIAGQQAGLSREQAQAEMGASGGISGFIADRYDTGPDAAMYANLIQQAAAAGDGSRVQVDGGMGANARAGLDAFGRPMGRFSSGGGGSGYGGGGGGGAPSGGGAIAPPMPPGMGGSSFTGGQTGPSRGGGFDASPQKSITDYISGPTNVFLGDKGFATSGGIMTDQQQKTAGSISDTMRQQATGTGNPTDAQYMAGATAADKKRWESAYAKGGKVPDFAKRFYGAQTA